MLTWKILWNARKRGLILPIKKSESGYYFRVDEIAARQKELMDEMDALDREIKFNAEKDSGGFMETFDKPLDTH